MQVISHRLFDGGGGGGGLPSPDAIGLGEESLEDGRQHFVLVIFLSFLRILEQWGKDGRHPLHHLSPRAAGLRTIHWFLSGLSREPWVRLTSYCHAESLLSGFKRELRVVRTDLGVGQRCLSVFSPRTGDAEAV